MSSIKFYGAKIDMLENNCAVITCDHQRLPVGLMLPLCGSSTQTECSKTSANRFRYQLQASLPLQKQLWQQTIIAKIENQAAMLRDVRGLNVVNMQRWVTDVRSGDAICIFENKYVTLCYKKWVIKDKYQILFTNVCIRAFASRLGMTILLAFHYLREYKGVKFLIDFYHVLHLQSNKNKVKYYG